MKTTTIILAALALALAGYSQTNNSVTVGNGKKYHADTGTNRTVCGRAFFADTARLTNGVDCKVCLKKLRKVKP